MTKLAIVDNGSSDNTLSLAMDFAQKTDIKTIVTSSKGKGLGETRQIAVNNAEGDYIVWVDDDHLLPRDYLRKQTEFMDKNLDVGIAAGVNTRVAPQAKTNILTGYIGARILPVSNPDSLFTCGSIFRLKALESVGGFDIRINGALEDVDVSRRIKAAGWKLAYNNSASHYHKDNQISIKSLWKKMRWYGYGNHFYFHKFKDRFSIMMYFPPLVLWGGIKMSYITYRLTHGKSVFLYTILYCFSLTAHYIGFIHAHYDKYGHTDD